jgi:hypothetical protein
VALGTVGPILKVLERRGYLRTEKTTKLLRTNELLQEWVTYYPANLRPTLQARHFQADRDKLLAIDLAPLGAYWGGEYAAERLTHYLKTERFTSSNLLSIRADLPLDPLTALVLLQMDALLRRAHLPYMLVGATARIAAVRAIAFYL